ncbi:MAG: DoxX family protein [Ignavibacteria bacterium]|jgi:Zn-dependent protease with chaperone function|nr:DoxX family protein [Ignavibacteria bacterium]
MKKIKVTYWIVTTLFCLFMLMDGVGGLMRVEEGQEIMRHLGYPVYIMTILGTFKILGAVGIFQNKFKILKEWAYAGCTFHFLGAAASRAYGGDSFILIISPLLFMAFMFISYFLWKKMERARTVN